MKAIVLLHTVSMSCGRMAIWGGAIGEWYHRVPHVLSGTSTPVLMGYIPVINTINSEVLKCMYD